MRRHVSHGRRGTSVLSTLRQPTLPVHRGSPAVAAPSNIPLTLSQKGLTSWGSSLGGMFLTKSEQDLFDPLTGLFGVSSPSEAIAKTPRLVVKLRIIPAKVLDRTITQKNEIAFVMCGLPAFSSLPAPRRVVLFFFHTPCFPTVTEQALKEGLRGVPSARWSMKRCQW